MTLIGEEPHREKLAPGSIGEDRPPNPLLPREMIYPIIWSKVALLLSSFLVIFSGLNFFAESYLSRYTSNLGYWLIQEKWKLIEEAPESIEWVILGDSSCNQGIDPDVWDQVIPTRSLNFCTIGDMLLLEDVWMLQRLIERGIKPKGVLIVHVYDVWHRNPKAKLLGRIPDRRVWSSGIPSVRLSAQERIREALSRYVPILSQNGALRRALVRPRQWFRRRFALTPKGFMPVSEANPRLVERDTEAHLQTVRRRGFGMSNANRAALAEISRISSIHGIEVFLGLSPIFEGLLANKDFLDHVNAMHHELSTWAEGGSRLYYLDEFLPFPITAMENSDHVTLEAARTYTARMAALVRSRTGTSSSTR